MKIVEINSVCGVGSTGRICTGIADIAEQCGHECVVAYGRSAAPKRYAATSYRIESELGVKAHALRTRLFGKTGTYSKNSTKKFLAWLDEYSPDILHMHNLHGYYINYPMLFEHIKRKNIRTVWTLHDCWAFTGHCAYFDMARCEKWKEGCGKCVQRSEYPKSFVDSSAAMFELKKNSFTNVPNMTLVTPSKWLAGLVKQSFLGEYDVRVINNGIDLDAFCPTDSDIKKSLGIDGKRMLLGVAYQWDARKGLDAFIELAGRLGDGYRTVLVGVGEAQSKTLPREIIGISRTESQADLARLYSAADVFVNPTLQENFPTVNLESLACGTPVITFDTGGSPEAIDDSCGATIEKGNVSEMAEQIAKICEDRPFTAEACRARASQFDYKRKFRQYVDLYTELNSGEEK